jgi:hypothetical protein
MNAGLQLAFAHHTNLLVGWIWLCLGFVSGLILGLGFHRENWLGGYGSLRRRLYRLAHISFFGLGAVNVVFYLTFNSLMVSGPFLHAASCGFILGAISMPVCCVLMAHWPRTRFLFAIPVLSLLLGGALTVAMLLRSDASASPCTSTCSPGYFARYTGSLTPGFSPVNKNGHTTGTVSTVCQPARKAVETAPVQTSPRCTGLKPGVNETLISLPVKYSASTLQRFSDVNDSTLTLP